MVDATQLVAGEEEDDVIAQFSLNEKGERVNTYVPPVGQKVSFGKAWAFVLMMAIMKTGKGMRKSKTSRYKRGAIQRG